MKPIEPIEVKLPCHVSVTQEFINKWFMLSIPAHNFLSRFEVIPEYDEKHGIVRFWEEWKGYGSNPSKSYCICLKLKEVLPDGCVVKLWVESTTAKKKVVRKVDNDPIQALTELLLMMQ